MSGPEECVRQTRREVGDAFRGELGIFAEVVVDDEGELGGDTGVDAECHHVQEGHVPGVGVAEDIELLANIGLDRHVFQEGESEERGDQRPRNKEDRGVEYP